jgi:hypothetical protein
LDDLDHGADERARGVILAAVAAGVAHVLDLGLVKMAELVLLGLRTEAEGIHVIDDLAEIVAALNFVFYLTEDFTDFVFDGVWAAGFLFEAMEVRKELLVDEIAQVIAGHGLVVIDLAIFCFGRGPAFPAELFVEDVAVAASVELRFGGFVLFQGIEVFQKDKP